ncbi:hypothetical protein [Priestia megaterium]|uniref:hypothetical protein n=1 Tax=Priestia megaterium TaxID=1404 RepID=UPI00101CD2A7|nr:hypothetical protein [Priestia megaterium]
MNYESENLSTALDHIAKALINIDEVILDLEKQKEFLKVNELEYVKMMLKVSHKIISYGLFHN